MADSRLVSVGGWWCFSLSAVSMDPQTDCQPPARRTDYRSIQPWCEDLVSRGRLRTANVQSAKDAICVAVSLALVSTR